ncbi:iduronate 2-sulfatase [Chelonus insularis]|uniref:iduronate 2-sulfatase n=1 Tax=Chelonus insularis TaxID=460826 RepID=UPI00158E9B4E|nr:iduronate 2-sulfatase [Chelonus insularis]
MVFNISALIVLVFILPLFSTTPKPNFLFIVVDDLRPALGCYGDTNAFTPNIDKLAEKSFLFTEVYAQQSLCAPSRNSLLTSRRPDTLSLYDVHSYWRSVAGNFTTLPQHLKNNGYKTHSIGKVFHPGKSSNFTDDYPYSWSQVPFHPVTDKYKNAPVCSSQFSIISNFIDPELYSNLVCPVNIRDMPKNTLPDVENLESAKAFLKDQPENVPFFLAVGFEKPHIPFKYPERFLDYHPLDKFKLKNYYWPKNISEVAYNPWNDLRQRHDVQQLNLVFPWEKIPEEFALKIIQSYYACVSYIDHLIGLLLSQLSDSKLHKHTIVILTSDHGWSLGEHGLWAKYSNFNVALRVPLIISTPKIFSKVSALKKMMKNGREESLKVHHLVELVDLFPSIAELAGIPIPLCNDINPMSINSTVSLQERILNNNLCSEGISFLPILERIKKNETITWKKAAFSQYPRPSTTVSWKPNSDEPRWNEIKIMGYSIKTARFRYTAWIPFNPMNKRNKSNWNILIAEELYDHYIDSGEMINQQGNIKYSGIKKKLCKRLKKGWKYALPPINVL